MNLVEITQLLLWKNNLRYWEIDGQTSVDGQKTAGFFYKTSFSNGNVLLKNSAFLVHGFQKKKMQ
uniref:Alternative protein DMD n=1 Tax=Homo sapiens TaxID=9606 RepID=L8ECA9_HUMAN|nr:alternative protein DMD [Homo sapiens]